jgi:two-component system sensor histidine kinase/response regulator
MAVLMREKSAAERYVVAVAAVTLAFAVRFGLYGSLENRIPFAFFTLSTLIAAWYGGLGPGLLAAVAGLALGDYFFLPPHSAERGLGEPERTAIGIYAMTNTLIVVLFWHLHSRLREVEHELRRLRSGEVGDAARAPEESAAPDRAAT